MSEFISVVTEDMPWEVVLIIAFLNIAVLLLNNRNAKQQKVMGEHIKDREQDRLTTTNYIKRLEEDIDELKLDLKAQNETHKTVINELQAEILTLKSENKLLIEARNTYRERIEQLEKQVLLLDALMCTVRQVIEDWLDISVEEITDEEKTKLDNSLRDFLDEMNKGRLNVR